MRGEPRIRGESAQMRQGVFLAQKEAGKVKGIKEMQELAQDTFNPGEYKTILCQTGWGIQSFVLIASKHALYNTGERITDLVAAQILDKIEGFLKDDFLAKRIAHNQVQYCEERDCCVAVETEDDTTCDTTIIVEEGSPNVYVFECGFTFIRLVTVFKVVERPFFVWEGQECIKKLNNGEYITDREFIPEVKLSDRQRKTR